MDRRAKHRPKPSRAAASAEVRKSAPRKGERHIRPSVRADDDGRIEWRPHWQRGQSPHTGSGTGPMGPTAKAQPTRSTRRASRLSKRGG